MKKTLVLFALMLFAASFSMPEAQAQKVKLSKESQKVLAKASKWVTNVDGFALIWYDTEGRMDLHETMSFSEKDYNPDLTYIKDEELGFWRLAVTIEENSRMPDKMSVIRSKYSDAKPYKRTGYIE